MEFSISVPANRASAKALLAFVEEAAAGLGAGSRVALRAVFVVEELFANTVMHGFGSDHASQVTVRLAKEGDTLAVRYTDAAPPFDTSAPPPDTRAGRSSDDSISLRVGGRGLAALHALADAVRYRREGSASSATNVTEVLLAID
jgi:serine/threonine-protein kinase RsbW